MRRNVVPERRQIAVNSYASSANSASVWWLRSPGDKQNNASGVDVYGNGAAQELSVAIISFAVRPVLHLDLSSSVWTKAGQVKAEGGNIAQVNSPSPTPYSWDQPSEPDEPTTLQPIVTWGWVVKPGSSSTPSSSVAPSNSNAPGDSAVTTSTDAPKQKKIKNSSTKSNIKNQKSYSLSKKVQISDADGIKSIRLNGKAVQVKKGKKKFSFKLSKYKKCLKKKGKWNKLVITDMEKKKKTLRFKVKMK